jgi:hypothetical protein
MKNRNSLQLRNRLKYIICQLCILPTHPSLLVMITGGKIRINPRLGLFAPTTRPESLYGGGLSSAAHSSFLFGDSEVSVERRIVPRLLGGADDTGGSGFEMPYYFFGDSSSSRGFLVLWCSFVDGIDRGIQLPLLYTLKSQFNLTQLAASAAIGLSQSPWLAKPFLALITDSIPLFGYRRKPYIVMSAGLNALSLALIAVASSYHFGGFWVPFVLMTLRTFGRAMIDAAAQGLLLEECRMHEHQEPPPSDISSSRTTVMVSRFQAAHRLGQFLNVCAGGYLMSNSSITLVYTSMAAAHLGTVLLALGVDEQRVEDVGRAIESSSRPSSFGTIISQSMTNLRLVVANNKPFQQVLEYAFLAVIVPSYEAPLAYYLIDSRHFSLASMSLVNIVQTTGSMLAPLAYTGYCQGIKFSTIMTNLTIASIPASLIPLVITTGLAERAGMNEVALAAFASFTLTFVNDLQMLPATVLVAQLAPKGLEGSSFSLLTVVEGTGRAASNVFSAILPYAVGAVAPKYERMSLYVVICTVFNVGPFSAIEGMDEVAATSSQELTTFTDVIQQLKSEPEDSSDDESIVSVDEELTQLEIIDKRN